MSIYLRKKFILFLMEKVICNFLGLFRLLCAFGSLEVGDVLFACLTLIILGFYWASHQDCS